MPRSHDSGGERIAYVEDADEEGNVLPGVPKTAASVAAGSPTKAKHSPNTGKSREARRERDPRRRSMPVAPSEAYSSDDSSVDSDSSTAHPNGFEARESRPYRHNRSASTRDVVEISTEKKVGFRPSATRHGHSSPSVRTSGSRDSRHDPSNYGISPTERVITPHVTSRPRAQTGQDSNRRYSSYNAPNQRPPLANARYSHHVQHLPHAPPPMVSPIVPPPQHMWPAAPPMPIPIAPPPRPDMFALPLSSRFDRGMQRPASAMGGSMAGSYEKGSYDEREAQRVTRRPSIRAREEMRDLRSREEEDRAREDRARMPPPPQVLPLRTRSARPPMTAPFAPPPQSAPVPAPPPPRESPLSREARRSSRHYEQNPFQPHPEPSPNYVTDGGHQMAMYEYGHEPLKPVPRQRRPSVGAHSITYDNGPSYRTEVAHSNRRNSYYNDGGGASLGLGVEDKLRDAESHMRHALGDQHRMDPAEQLTMENVRKASRHGVPSHSSRSSGSRDESDFRQSNTTRTTRSSSHAFPNDDNVTVRVKGATMLEVGGAKLQCADGAEISIVRTDGPGNSGASVRGGASDQSSYYDADERRARAFDRMPSRIRGASQASRTTYDPYGGGVVLHPSAGYGAPIVPPPPSGPYGQHPFAPKPHPSYRPY